MGHIILNCEDRFSGVITKTKIQHYKHKNIKDLTFNNLLDVKYFTILLGFILNYRHVKD